MVYHVKVWRIVNLRRAYEPDLLMPEPGAFTMADVGAQLAKRYGIVAAPITVSDVETYYVTLPDTSRIYFRATGVA